MAKYNVVRVIRMGGWGTRPIDNDVKRGWWGRRIQNKL